jgi:hypothetical protein
MNNSKRIWVWVGVVVVVAAVVVWFVWKPTPAIPPVASNPVPVYAPQGQLVSEFPSSLIIGTSSVVNGSYAINYSSSTNQYTAEFNSSSSVISLYASYKQYLTTNGWTITNDITKYPTSRGLYASNASSDVTVAIATKNKGAQVTISYVLK